MIQDTNKVRVMILAALAAIVALAGCGQPPSAGDHRDTAPSTCAAPPPVAATDKPVIGVLTGITADDQIPTITAARAEAISRITDAGSAMNARLLIDTIGGGAGDADLAVNVQLDVSGANNLARQTNARCKRAAVQQAVTQIQQRPAAQLVTDVLESLRRMGGHLRGLTDRQVSVVVFSHMLNATPALNLADPATLERPAATLVDDLAQAHLLPDCHGWDVYIVGAGRTRTGGLNDVQSVQLQAFWAEFFARCGGRVVAYDSVLTQFPVPDARPEPAAAIPVSPVAVRQPAAAPAANTVTITLSSTVLFDTASAVLSPSAEAALTATLATLGERLTSGHISVVGYTDTTPANLPGGNTGLSQRRAQAVADWLISHGAPPASITALGRGPEDPIADNDTAEGRARNRRVEITVDGAGGGS